MPGGVPVGVSGGVACGVPEGVARGVLVRACVWVLLPRPLCLRPLR